MKHHFIVNPAAGKGNLVNSLTERIHAAAFAAGCEYEIYKTVAPGDAGAYVARTLAADDGHHRFYACGGDGTLNEVVNGAPLSTRAEYAVIPIGTGNDFCRNFDDRAAFLDIRRQLDGSAIPLDLIRYGERYCVNMLTIGFDCNVVERTVQFNSHPLVPSGMAYSLGVAVSLLHKMTTDMHITLSDGEIIERPLLLMSVANGRFYGGGFQPNPRAMIDDGLLDVNIVEKVSRPTFLSFIGCYKAGRHLEEAAKYVTYRRTTSLSLHFDQETTVCVDSETELATALEITLVPHATRFVLPIGTRCLSTAEATECGADVMA